ncbi:MAG: hypothetical protein Q9159_003368 [Coniocarpon cinnabarinum]
MSALIETSLGDLTIDLLVEEAPKASENFLKLCKLKYFNFSPIHTVQPSFSLQTGDPIGPGSADSDGGSSIWGLLPQAPISKKTFIPEMSSKLKHTERGTVSFATTPSNADPDVREAASQFLITLGDNLDYLDGKAAIFGRVVEGFDTLEKINTAFLDHDGRPLKDIRIRHTIVLDEAGIPDPPGFAEPPSSPVPTSAQLATVRIADDEELDENADQEALEQVRKEREARAQALTLEMVGDLPFAEVAPPENVLFVCKLNPVTQDEDLELIFGRFGKILSCEVIRDKKTGDSLQYAFIEFAEQKSCEQAYFKMDGVLIDDHRIHVDFSQSVSRMADVWDRVKGGRWSGGGRGGFGGVESLEKKRQYRAEDDRPKGRQDGHSMVFNDRSRNHDNNHNRDKDRHERERPRHGAKPRHDDRSRRNYSRSRSPPPRHRDRSHDKYRDDHDRRRFRSPDRHRERDRRRDRSRNGYRAERYRP